MASRRKHPVWRDISSRVAGSALKADITPGVCAAKTRLRTALPQRWTRLGLLETFIWLPEPPSPALRTVHCESRATNKGGGGEPSWGGETLDFLFVFFYFIIIILKYNNNNNKKKNNSNRIWGRAHSLDLFWGPASFGATQTQMTAQLKEVIDSDLLVIDSVS